MPTLAKVLRELKVEDALLYLDQVKMAFGDKPEIYNEFLDIMKNFKAQEIDTPGVIQQVSHLFHGYSKLILGFNTFLPDGYKIELPIEGDSSAMTVITPSGVSASIAGAPLAPSKLEKTHKIGGGDVKVTEVTVRPDVAGAPVEFDHAITYVTTIKKRFAHEPETYKAFLEILHTYQKEQRSIKDVLEQVSQLFADHPDLLKEFTYFLPDAVQEQAKERLSRAARESELRRARHRGLNTSTDYLTDSANIGHPRLSKGRRSLNNSSLRTSGDSVGGVQCFGPRVCDAIDQLPACQVDSVLNKKSPVPATVLDDRLASDVRSHCALYALERRCFERIKESFALTPGSLVGVRDDWAEFLKCLDLYSQNLLHRSEMIQLSAALFRSHGLSEEVLDAFKKLLQYQGSECRSLNDQQIGVSHKRFMSAKLETYPCIQERASFLWASTPLHEIDFSRCKHGTPSYRALPTSMSHPRCGGRSDLDQNVLNDVWVSQPVGSEETNSFKHVRKNVYEEELFKCEDERFELDMITDSNAAAIASLELINTAVQQSLRSTVRSTFTAIADAKKVSPPCKDENIINDSMSLVGFAIDSVALYATHLNAILRVYGEHGAELLELMYKSPQAVLPMVLKRLKQKGMEWCKKKESISASWKEQLSQNIVHAADHRSFHSHQKEQKSVLPRHLVQDLIDVNSSQIERNTMHSTESSSDNSEMLLHLGHNANAIHLTLFHLIYDVLEQSLMSRVDKNRVLIFWRHFFARFLDITREENVIDFALGRREMQTIASVTDAAICLNCSDSRKSSNEENLNSNPLILLGELSRAELRVACVDDDGRARNFSSKASGGRQGGQDVDTEQSSTNGSLVSTQHVYIFFRLYHQLFQRFDAAHGLCFHGDFVLASGTRVNDCMLQNDNLKTQKNRFEAFVSMVYGLVDGSLDAFQYEDGCRCMLGRKAYEVFSVDKLIVRVLKQLQLVVNDVTSCKLLALWQLGEEQRSAPNLIKTAPMTSPHDSPATANSNSPTGQILSSCPEASARRLLKSCSTVHSPLYTIRYTPRDCETAKGRHAFIIKLSQGADDNEFSH